MTQFDVAVIGGGPAGLAAAAAAERAGAKTALVERENRLGGILKQCIHDGFGLIRFGEKLSGPEYSHRYIEELKKTAVQVYLQNFVVRMDKRPGGFELVLSGSGGIDRIFAKALVLSTGCRERTARQASIYGTRPAGVLTAGTAQFYTNILGQLPCRRCVILGSGDIGLIMARRLTLEGAQVLGVYEAKSTPSGLSRNIAQCLDDFDIPLHTSRTVSRVFGHERLEAVEIMATDEAMRPIPGTEERIECDGLILSVGLIPENEFAESLGVPIHGATKGPVCDQHCMTEIPGVFSCGNALLVNDLVDYVSESGEEAGKSAAAFAAAGTDGGQRNMADFETDSNFLCMSPQRLDLDRLETETTVFLRSRDERGKTRIRFTANGKEIFTKQFSLMRPPEMERLSLRLGEAGLKAGDRIRATMEQC
ncbi:MAG: NAD(P)/FAD-dependent oxidoreductase [Treponema sp.]|nr:NAD(P)/FAD-dependent oxidoreductase [Treponema sp.]